ncbi:MAG: hypothetical protein AB7F75_08015 [Planctomycetota bacterium]
MFSVGRLVDLWALQSALSGWAPVEGIAPHKDPTMSFTALLWGRDLALRRGLSAAFWPLRVSLFRHGDDLVELLVAKTGFERFRRHYESVSRPEAFYLFEEAAVSEAGASSLLNRVHEGYVLCQQEVLRRFPPESAQLGDAGEGRVASGILRTWIAATHCALRSVLAGQGFGEAVARGDGAGALRICEQAEEQKNVKVVMAILAAGDVATAGGRRPFRAADWEPLVRASSRWFTLLDDQLDLESDAATGEPNRARAILTLEGPEKGAQRIKEETAKARDDFERHFPVLPRLAADRIERAVLKEGRSPF